MLKLTKKYYFTYNFFGKYISVRYRYSLILIWRETFLLISQVMCVCLYSWLRELNSDTIDCMGSLQIFWKTTKLYGYLPLYFGMACHHYNEKKWKQLVLFCPVMMPRQLCSMCFCVLHSPRHRSVRQKHLLLNWNLET